MARWLLSMPQRGDNIHVRNGFGGQEFIAMRTRRDTMLEMPTLLLPAVQVNMCAGMFLAQNQMGCVTSRSQLPQSEQIQLARFVGISESLDRSQHQRLPTPYA